MVGLMLGFGVGVGFFGRNVRGRGREKRYSRCRLSYWVFGNHGTGELGP